MAINIMSAKIDFPDWLQAEMEKRGWNQAELARRSDLSRATISEYVNSRRQNYDPAALAGIARAFKMPPDQVMRAAGLLPAVDPEVDPDVLEASQLLQQMGDETRDQAVRFLRMMLEAQEREDRKKKNGRSAAQRRRSSTAE